MINNLVKIVLCTISFKAPCGSNDIIRFNNITIAYTIIIPLKRPYAIPPASLNCFIIGRLVIASDIRLINNNITLDTINKPIIVPPYIMLVATVFDVPGNISFLAPSTILSVIFFSSAVLFEEVAESTFV